MPHIVIFIHKFISALQHLKHCCHIIGTEHSVSASNHCNSHVHGYSKKAYILKYLLDLKKNNLINIGCATLHHLSMTYITVNPFPPSVPIWHRLVKLSILIEEGIIKKISYERRDYESVDEKSLS